jgi:hypothetical protein
MSLSDKEREALQGAIMAWWLLGVAVMVILVILTHNFTVARFDNLETQIEELHR